MAGARWGSYPSFPLCFSHFFFIFIPTFVEVKHRRKYKPSQMSHTEEQLLSLCDPNLPNKYPKLSDSFTRAVCKMYIFCLLGRLACKQNSFYVTANRYFWKSLRSILKKTNQTKVDDSVCMTIWTSTALAWLCTCGGLRWKSMLVSMAGKDREGSCLAKPTFKSCLGLQGLFITPS